MISSKTQMHPFVAIGISVLLFFCGLLFVKETWFPFYFLGIMLAYFFYGYREALLKTLIVFLPFIFLAYLLTAIGPFREDRWQLAFRMSVLALAAVPVITLKPTKLVTAFQQAKAPSWLTMSVLLVFRFFSLLKEEITTILRAIRMRGISLLKTPIVWLRSFILPLFVRLLSMSDTMTLSLETRGVTLGKKVIPFRPVPFQAKDLVLAVVFVVLHVYLLGQRGGTI